MGTGSIQLPLLLQFQAHGEILRAICCAHPERGRSMRLFRSGSSLPNAYNCSSEPTFSTSLITRSMDRRAPTFRPKALARLHQRSTLVPSAPERHAKCSLRCTLGFSRRPINERCEEQLSVALKFSSSRNIATRYCSGEILDLTRLSLRSSPLARVEHVKPRVPCTSSDLMDCSSLTNLNR